MWRRSWNLTLGNPARFSTLWSIFKTLSGEIGPPVGDGNTYSPDTFYRICPDGQGAVGIFRFQRGFYNLSVDPRYLPANVENALLQVDILPFQSQQFAKQQKNMLVLLSQGYKNAEISEMTGLSIPTIKTHTSLAYKTLGVGSTMDAVLRARELGVIE